MPTNWLSKVTSTLLIVTEGAETGGGSTAPPPPPQEVNRTAKTIQTPAKIAVSVRRRWRSLVSMSWNSILTTSLTWGATEFPTQHPDPEAG